MPKKKDEEYNISDAIDEIVAQESMHFEENLKLVVKDLINEVNNDLNYARKKIERMEKKVAAGIKKKTEK